MTHPLGINPALARLAELDTACSKENRRGISDVAIARESTNMEPILLFIVEDAFQIRGRGCVLVPGPAAGPGAPILRIGDPIRLIKPGGESIDTEIRGVEMIGHRQRPTVPLLLPNDITKEQVPTGTKVLLLRQKDPFKAE